MLKKINLIIGLICLVGVAYLIAIKKNLKITKAFTNSYPNATTEIITPRNFFDFCKLNE